jgi:hypothetical protein
VHPARVNRPDSCRELRPLGAALAALRSRHEVGNAIVGTEVAGERLEVHGLAVVAAHGVANDGEVQLLRYRAPDGADLWRPFTPSRHRVLDVRNRPAPLASAEPSSPPSKLLSFSPPRCRYELSPW